MTRKSFLFGIMLMGLFCGVFASKAMASGIDVKNIPRIQEPELLPQEKFEEVTVLTSGSNPYKDPLLDYSVRFPKGWAEDHSGGPSGLKHEPIEPLLSKTVLGILGRYASAPKNLQRSYFKVEALDLTYEISARNWFINFILNNGLSMTALTEKGSRETEAVYVEVLNDVSYAVRVKILINGPRVIMARYYLPQENFADEKVLQAQVMQSFRLKNVQKGGIEALKEYAFLDQSYFYYPSSWAINTKPILSIERMGALLYQNTGGSQVLDGQIKINVVSKLLKTTLGQEIKDFKSKMQVKNYSFGPLIETLEYHYDPSISLGRTETYQLVPSDPVNMKQYEIVVSVMEGQDYYYILSLITPAREQDYYTWSRNMEAIKIVAESMRRYNVDTSDPYYDYLNQK